MTRQEAYSSLVERINAKEFEPEPPVKGEGYGTKLVRQEKARNKARTAFAEAYGVKDHPKEKKLWDLAWYYGHSDGYGEILSYYHDWSELIRDD